ncbi:MAG: hypothetical protein JWO71_39 [Candidatus Acidoferrum typicum]|nr:hypothetical protein [Candidatus Acidoferrum typicum]
MNTDAKYGCVLECKKQSPTSYFVLARAESQEECAGQLGWSTDRWPLTVLCDECFGLFEYSEQDIQKVSVDSMDQETLQPKRIWNIEVQCAQENGGFPIRMHFQAGIGSVRAVTAEVASSSLVVPAIHSKRVERSSLQPTRVQKGTFLHPFCTPFRQLEPFSRARFSPV